MIPSWVLKLFGHGKGWKAREEGEGKMWLGVWRNIMATISSALFLERSPQLTTFPLIFEGIFLFVSASKK